MFPKRTGSENATPQPSKRIKYDPSTIRTHDENFQEDHQDDQDQLDDVAEASNKRSGSSEAWETLDGDDRTPLRVRVVAPNRLKLRFRHKVNGTIRSFEFSKKVAEIDWNSKKDVDAITIWRNSVFLRSMGFEPLVNKTRWNDSEKAFLELFHEEVLRAGTDKKNFKAPAITKITFAFNLFFETEHEDKGELEPYLPRDEVSVGSFIRRATNTNLRALYKRLNEQFGRSNLDNVYLPSISKQQVEAHMAQQGMTTNGKTQTRKKTAGESSKNSSHRAGRSASGQSGSSSGTSRKEGRSATVNSTPTVQRKNAQMKKLAETEAISTLAAELEEMRMENWVIPQFPANNDEALRKYHEAHGGKVSGDSWNMQTVEDLESRFQRNPPQVDSYYQRVPHRKGWYEDRLETSTGKNSEDDSEQEPPRHSAAANINGLLGAAIVPPVGYRGPLVDLISKRLLSENDIISAESSAQARSDFNKNHDAAFDERYGQVLSNMDDGLHQMEGKLSTNRF